MAKRKKTTSERVLDILMRKVRRGEKLSKHEREILAVVTYEGLKKDRELGRKRKTRRTHRKKTAKKRRAKRKKARRG